MKIMKWTVDKQEGMDGSSGHFIAFSAGFWGGQRARSADFWSVPVADLLVLIETWALRWTRCSTSLLTMCRCSLMSLKCWTVSYVPRPPAFPWCWAEPICFTDSWKLFLHRWKTTLATLCIFFSFFALELCQLLKLPHYIRGVQDPSLKAASQVHVLVGVGRRKILSGLWPLRTGFGRSCSNL